VRILMKFLVWSLSEPFITLICPKNSEKSLKIFLSTLLYEMFPLCVSNGHSVKQLTSHFTIPNIQHWKLHEIEVKINKITINYHKICWFHLKSHFRSLTRGFYFLLSVANITMTPLKHKKSSGNEGKYLLEK
jgi:hypothetical protein